MAVQFEKLDGAQLEYDGTQVRKNRIATITNLDTTVPALMLEDGYAQIAAAGAPLGSTFPGSAGLRLQNIQIVPLSGTIARGVLKYETVPWSGGSVYLIRDTSYVTSINTQLTPGPDKTPFRVSYDPLKDVHPLSVNTLEDTLTLQVYGPMRSYQITQIGFGAVPDAPRTYFRYVNADTFLGMAKGFWLFTKFATELSRYSSAFTVDAEILTKQDEDWSSYGVFQDRTTGRYATSDMVATAIDAAKAKAYVYGKIYPSSAAEEGRGVIRFGPYQTTNFGSIFPGISL